MVDADGRRMEGRRLNEYTISSSCGLTAHNENNEKKGYHAEKHTISYNGRAEPEDQWSCNRSPDILA